VDFDDYTIRVVATGPSYYFDSADPATSCGSPVFRHEGDDVGAYAWNLPVYDLTVLSQCL
jgi:hypothetical protein